MMLYIDRAMAGQTKAAPAFRLGRVVEIAALVGAASFLLFVAVQLIGIIPAKDYGLDFRAAVTYARQALDGAFYRPHQLSGPYEAILLEDNLYPPSALFLFVPFLVLPAILWWAVPIGSTLYVLWRLRPSPLSLAVMLALLAWPRALGAYIFGNTDMWAVAAVAAGLRWGWPAVLLTIKPTLAPLALVGLFRRLPTLHVADRSQNAPRGVAGVIARVLAGVRNDPRHDRLDGPDDLVLGQDRPLAKLAFDPFLRIHGWTLRSSWLIALVLFALVNLPLLPLWSEYVTAMRNLSIGVDYSLGSLPLMAVPVVGWLGRSYVTMRR